METKLVVIDGNSILYREFFALSTALKNSQGQPTNAVFGFANQIIKIINELKPTHMVVAFDVSKKTFRNDIFPVKMSKKTGFFQIKFLLC